MERFSVSANEFPSTEGGLDDALFVALGDRRERDDLPALVRDGRIKRLIINMPPRHLKSLASSVALPAWLLGNDPTKAMINVTYVQELSDKFARDCRAIMMAAWYRDVFPTRLSSARSPLQELITSRGGFRLATSVGGVLTGRGADYIVIDDPLKPSDALSESRRVAANEWFDGTLYSRLNDKTPGRHRHHHATPARGRSRRPCPQAAAVKQLVNRAASGEARATQLLLGLVRANEAEPAEHDAGQLGDADKIVMAEMARRLREASS